MDVARTLVLPDLTLPSVALLSTLALYWDTIDLVVDPEGTPNPSAAEQEAIFALHDAGVLRVSLIRTLPEARVARDEEARQIASVWAQTSPGTTAATLPRELAEQIVVARARRLHKRWERESSSVWTLPVSVGRRPRLRPRFR